ncbi:MAG: 4Fe-4S binding protein [Thioploca sp.]|nr:4Fe-4S binding protein [Thioploca sp.]
MLEELRTHLQQELRIPTIRSERCVHAHIETASCRACVESCPQQAWHLDDNSLGIDIEACDGCGLCAPVCPQGAILHAHEPLLRQLNQTVVALAACEHTQLNGEGIMPCLHALGLHDLLKLYRQGVRGLMTSMGDCTPCSRQVNRTHLAEALTTVNAALTQRHYPTFTYQELPAEAWQTQRQQLTPPLSQQQLSRRHFLRRGLQNAVQETLRWQGLLPQDSEKFLPPGTLLPKTPEPANLPYVPQIDSSRCDGCDACFNVCPHEVLFLDIDNPQYVIVAEQCTGCQICVDVCKPQAIHIEQWIIPPVTHLPLHYQQCRRCGVPFHRPIDYVANQNLCHICNQVNHHRNLFQVISE